MAKKIRETTDEAQEESQQEAATSEGGVWVINNFLNRIFTFEDKTTFKSERTKQLITDPALIDKLTKLSESPNNRIFIEPAE